MKMKLTEMEKELLQNLDLFINLRELAADSCENMKNNLLNNPMTWDKDKGWIIVKPIFAKKHKGKYRTISKK